MSFKGSLTALAVATAACAAGAVPAAAQSEEPQVMLIFDSSGSMKKRIGARSKMEIARDAIASFVMEAPADVPLGLMAYGHRRAKDCSDIEVLISPEPMSGPSIERAVDAMRPRGETPIAESLRQAAAYMKGRTSVPTVVIVTDGEEACNADPCAAARELKRAEVEFKAHVVGFGLNERQSRAVKCVADETGGRFLAADDAVTLASALRRVVPAEPEPAPVVKVAEKTLWYEEFEGDALGEVWSVRNEDTDNYIVDGGELVIINAAEHRGPRAATSPNIFDATLDLPAGDWDLSLQATLEFNSGREALVLGLSNDDGDAIYSIVGSSSGAQGYSMNLHTRQYKGFGQAAEAKETYVYPEGEMAKIDNAARALASRPTTLTLHKRGRRYFTSVDNGPRGEEGKTRTLTLLRAPRRLTLFLWKWDGNTGDAVAKIDWVKLTQVD